MTCSPQTVLASDQKNLLVDAFMRYRITDPLKFFQALNNTARGEPDARAHRQ